MLVNKYRLGYYRFNSRKFGRFTPPHSSSLLLKNPDRTASILLLTIAWQCKRHVRILVYNVINIQITNYCGKMVE
jgi:hypothetical protein